MAVEILTSELKPFLKRSDKILFLSEKRFFIPLKTKRLRRKKAMWSSGPYAVVEGYLHHGSLQPGAYDLEALARGELQELPIENLATTCEALFEKPTIGEAFIDSKIAKIIRKAARLVSAKDLCFEAAGRELKVRAYSKDVSNNHWYEPYSLKMGKPRLKSGRELQKAMRVDHRHSFQRGVDLYEPAEFKIDKSTLILKALPEDDLEMRFLEGGYVEATSVRTGHTYLF